jgi:hypothetical protein
VPPYPDQATCSEHCIRRMCSERYSGEPWFSVWFTFSWQKRVAWLALCVSEVSRSVPFPEVGYSSVPAVVPLNRPQPGANAVEQLSQSCEKRLLASSYFSGCPFSWNSSASTGGIFVTFDIWLFCEKSVDEIRVSLGYSTLPVLSVAFIACCVNDQRNSVGLSYAQPL